LELKLEREVLEVKVVDEVPLEVSDEVLDDA
jgi:hypothetical protein